MNENPQKSQKSQLTKSSSVGFEMIRLNDFIFAAHALKVKQILRIKIKEAPSLIKSFYRLICGMLFQTTS